MYNPYQQGGYPQGYSYQVPYGQNAPLQSQSTGYYAQNPNANQQLPPQQPGLFQGQQTGFQPQFQQPQQTGFQNQQPQQQQFQPQQTGFGFQGFQNAQATGFNQTGFGQQQQQPQQQAPQQTQQPLQQQKTGFSAALAGVTENTELKIPNIRLSFITAGDQTKFEHLFRTAIPQGEQAILGDSARDILLRSGLAPVALAEIWSLADTNKLGSLLFPEFALALHLCNLALRGEPLPGVLPERWLNEVQSFVDAISFAVPEDPNKILANTPFSLFGNSSNQRNDDWMSAPSATGSAPPPPTTSFTAQPTGGFQPSAPSLTAQRTGGGTLIPLQPQQTAGFVPANLQIPAQRTGGLTAQTTGYQQPQPQLTSQNTGFLQPQLTAQTTGYQQPQLTAQTTGYQQGQLGAQRTGSLPATSFQAQATGSQQPQSTFQPQITGFQPQQTGIQQQQTGGYLQSQPTGKPGQWGFVSMPTGGIPGLNAMELHFLPSSQTPSNNLQNQMGGHLKSNVTWAITKQEKQIYDGIFSAWDSTRRGYIDGDVAISIFGKSGLGRPDLESIWNLCDSSNRGKLNKDEFAVAMHLVYRRLNGFDIPLRLPPELVPPSAKYLQDSVDLLKNSLKGGSAKKASTPQPPATSASRFKNDDNNVGYVSNSRHRSRRSSEQPQTSVPNSKSNDLSVADLKKLIREKQILLDAVDLEDQHNSIVNKQAEDSNQREIESLKYRIKETQTQINKFSLGGSHADKKQLLDKLDHYTKDKVPSLISRVYQVNSEIAKVKAQLAKSKLQKQFPEWNPEGGEESIVGTGPRGEVTESDRRKFKSKQLLKQRMAALTGKPYSDGSNKEADSQYQEEVKKANIESESQSAIINDIEKSIKELEEGASVYLQVSVKSETGLNKWENGEGISGALKQFVDELNAFSRAQKKQTEAASTSQTSQQVPRAVPAQATASGTSAATQKAAPAYTTPAERAAYIKAQAEKRMNERLAKLGISRNKTGGTAEEQQKSEPVENQTSTASQAQVNRAVETPKASQPTKTEQPVPQTPKAEVKAPVKPEEESDDEEDAEYAALLKQKQEMEARKKERDLKKKKEKEERLAKLKREMAALENGDNSSDEEVAAAPLYNPSSINQSKPEPVKSTPATQETVSQAAARVPEEQTKTPAQANEGQARHESNPFAKLGGNKDATSSSGTPSLVPGANTNPFFKSNKSSEPVDQKKIDAQRASQRGLGSESWSDEEENSSDDEEPNRAGAAKLASLLFGGMPQPISRATTGNAQFQSQAAQTRAPEEQKETTPIQAPPIPQAPPVQQAPVPEAPATQIPAVLDSTQHQDEESSSDDEFTTPSPQAYPLDSPPTAPGDAAAPSEIPPIPYGVPPIPNGVPPIPTGAPPIPTEVPPTPNAAPPAPPAPPVPTSAPPIPNGAPPPPAGVPPPPSFLSAPSAPPPPPSLGGASSAPPSGGAPNIGALLGQIQGGLSLKKVDDSQKNISDGATVGRVL